MTKIKICGLKRTEDISYVNELLPDFAGFVFAKSSRQVDAKKAAEFKKQLSPIPVRQRSKQSVFSSMPNRNLSPNYIKNKSLILHSCTAMKPQITFID